MHFHKLRKESAQQRHNCLSIEKQMSAVDRATEFAVIQFSRGNLQSFGAKCLIFKSLRHLRLLYVDLASDEFILIDCVLTDDAENKVLVLL